MWRNANWVKKCKCRFFSSPQKVHTCQKVTSVQPVRFIHLLVQILPLSLVLCSIITPAVRSEVWHTLQEDSLTPRFAHLGLLEVPFSTCFSGLHFLALSCAVLFSTDLGKSLDCSELDGAIGLGNKAYEICFHAWFCVNVLSQVAMRYTE